LMKKYGKCQVCRSKQKLQIHHKKYDTKSIKDCQLVCFKCHKIIHRKHQLNDIPAQ
jgi:predicted HNH restriction endonuclease